MYKVYVLLIIILILPTSSVFSEARLGDWIGTYNINNSTWKGTLIISDSGGDCGGFGCDMTIIYKSDSNIYTADIEKLDKRLQHIVFYIDFPSYKQRFDAYLSNWNKIRLSGVNSSINHRFNFYAEKKYLLESDQCIYKRDTNFSVWRKTNKDSIIKRDYTTNGFNKEWKAMRSKGYHLENINFHNNLWHGIFKKGTGKYAMWRNFSHSEFDKKWREMSRNGYRLYDLETYLLRGKRKWAGLFKKGTGKHALWTNFSTNGFSKKRKSMANKGMKLIDLEVFLSRGSLKWSGVWIAGKDGLLNRNYNGNEFKQLVSNRGKSGYKLIDVEAYKVNGKRKWAGIWEKNQKKQRVYYESDYCYMLGTDKHKEYELIDLEYY